MKTWRWALKVEELELDPVKTEEMEMVCKS